MHYPKHLYKHPLHLKIEKIYRQLQKLTAAGREYSLQQIKGLQKSYRRYLKKLTALSSQLVKAGSAAAFTMFLSTQTNAQYCNHFDNANAANPLRISSGTGNGFQPVFVDIDNDGDYDCYMQTSYFDRKPMLFKNVGTKEVPRYVKDSADGFESFVDSEPYAHNGDGPEFADVDGDGDYDCFIGEGYYSSGFFGPYQIKYFENTGTKTKPHFAENEAKNPFSFVSGSYNLKFTIADIDGDGDYDLYYEDLYSSATYKNVGTKTKPSFKNIGGGFSNGGYSHRTYYDWNKDGLIDYFQNGNYYRNTGPYAHDLNYKQDDNGPSFSFDPFYLQTLVDLNKDGVPEAFDRYNNYNTLTAVPVIKATTANTGIILLHASPMNEQYKYQWQRNGNNIPGAFLPNLPVIIPGYYTVAITDSCGTGVSLPYRFRTHAIAFAEADASAIQFAKTTDNNEYSLKAYPNPFTQQFTLTLGTVGQPNTMVRITDVLGRIISTEKANSNTVILGSNLQKGVYLVQVLQNKVVVYSQKIIKE